MRGVAWGGLPGTSGWYVTSQTWRRISTRLSTGLERRHLWRGGRAGRSHGSVRFNKTLSESTRLWPDQMGRGKPDRPRCPLGTDCRCRSHRRTRPRRRWWGSALPPRCDNNGRFCVYRSPSAQRSDPSSRPCSARGEKQSECSCGETEACVDDFFVFTIKAMRWCNSCFFQNKGSFQVNNQIQLKPGDK